ncbi:ChbG/HpnK family deacetylase [Photorhabdus bodei]|uniref:ChbG/HpnK family deacetylase n=1 Tax=Photorhabdus bodei TaxID=2029681 RepID=UPI00232B2F98|nr:ChbG/HpnK family deacetylase [Photorhabdus bodei]MDB6367016.1 ChbG/HpnK family deacetylase [Photorhabdus bodei]
MNIIFNADDFGLSKEVTDSIIFSYKKGIISHTTMLVNMDDSDRAAMLYKNHPQLRIGLHINLIEGSPLTEEIKSSKLFCENGKFKLNIKRRRLFISIKQYVYLYKEILAQLNKLKNYSINVSHIDSHQHTHTILPILMVTILIAKKNDLKIRLSRTGNISSCSLPIRMYKYFINALLKINKVSFTDQMISYDDYIEKRVSIKSKKTEIMIHPLLKDNILIDYTSGLTIGNFINEHRNNYINNQ